MIDLRLGDCLELMRDIPDGSVDAVITDPPYANGTQYDGLFDDTQEHLGHLINKFMPQVQRIAKRILITCGVPNMWLYPAPDWVLNWSDPSGEGGCKWGFPSWQPILAYGKDPYLQNGLGRRSDTIIKRYLREKNIDHPCHKPIGFMKWLIGRATFEGDTILDPFMGSGTTGVACVKLNRNFIGMEINPTYFEIAKRRIEEAQMQLALPMVIE